MRPIAYNQLFYLSNEFTNPKRAFWLMRDYMEKAIRLSSETMAKDTILRLMKNRVGFKDVENMAESLVNKHTSGDKSRDHKVPVARLEYFRALKFSRLKSSRAVKPYC